MQVQALTNTAFATANTPFSFGAVFANFTAGALVIEGSDTSASTGYTDLVTVPLGGMIGVNGGGRLPKWIRVKTAATVYMLGN